MKNYVSMCLLFLLACSSRTDVKTIQVPEREIVDVAKEGDCWSNIISTWCFEKKDSIDFKVEVIKKNDSAYCRYVNVMYGGKYLNAFDNGDWAFQIPLKEVCGQKSIVAKNAYNGHSVRVKLITKGKNFLKWELDSVKNSEDAIWLPVNVELHRCK